MTTEPKAKKPRAKTHDYASRYWGHDYVISDVIERGKRLKMMGWGHGLRVRDYLILENEGSTTRYRIKAVKYFSNPSDMWSAEVDFAPRKR